MLRMLLTAIVLFIIVVAPPIKAQTSMTGWISGRVTDRATGEPLTFVNVRIDGTSLGAVSDGSGAFIVRSVPAGARTLFASRLGYAMTTANVLVVPSDTEFVQLRMETRSIEVAPTEITADPSEWRSNYLEFVKLLLGNTPNSRQCTILNPEVIALRSTGKGFLRAESEQPIRVENRALGYLIEVSIARFERADNRLTTWMRTSFTGLVPQDEQELQRWKRERRIAFLGSQRHFLRSLANRKAEDEGFTLFTISSLGRPEAMRSEIRGSRILLPGPSIYQKRLRVDKVLEVEYARAELPDGFTLRRRKGTDHQISWLESNATQVTINTDGSIDDLTPFVTHGFWAWQRLGEQLPADYDPDPKDPSDR